MSFLNILCDEITLLETVTEGFGMSGIPLCLIDFELATPNNFPYIEDETEGGSGIQC